MTVGILQLKPIAESSAALKQCINAGTLLNRPARCTSRLVYQLPLRHASIWTLFELFYRWLDTVP